MKFYVPEIGDEIVLTRDWTFTLLPEGRNTDLGAFMGCYLHRGRSGGDYFSGWVSETELPQMRSPDYNVDYPDQNLFRGKGIKSLFGGHPGSLDHTAYSAACKKAEDSNPEYVKYWEDHQKHQEECGKVWKPFLEITLKAGQVLKIDRIYVRKGATDFSSITFYAKDMGEISVTTGWSWHNRKVRKKTALRFWAKLVDCNTIEFEPVNKE